MTVNLRLFAYVSGDIFGGIRGSDRIYSSSAEREHEVHRQHQMQGVYARHNPSLRCRRQEVYVNETRRSLEHSPIFARETVSRAMIAGGRTS